MEKDVMLTVADLMALSARTAPKGGGHDYIVQEIISGDTLKTLGEAMIEFAETPNGKPFIARDGHNIMDSDAVLLIGLKDAEPSNLNCGACGFDQCSDCKIKNGPEFNGPVCAFRVIDLGIALGSAARTAMNLNADNRMMYSAGSVAIRIGLIDADIAVAIPISASGKNIYFDR